MSLGHLFRLSPELICLILQEISSTREFYSFVRTSSQIYAAFAAVKEPFLSGLLKRALSAEGLRHDALVTIRSSLPIS